MCFFSFHRIWFVFHVIHAQMFSIVRVFGLSQMLPVHDWRQYRKRGESNEKKNQIFGCDGARNKAIKCYRVRWYSLSFLSFHERFYFFFFLFGRFIRYFFFAVVLQFIPVFNGKRDIFWRERFLLLPWARGIDYSINNKTIHNHNPERK